MNNNNNKKDFVLNFCGFVWYFIVWYFSISSNSEEDYIFVFFLTISLLAPI